MNDEEFNQYVAKAEKLSKAQQERVLSRMSGKLPKRLVKNKISETEAIARQLMLEDEQLEEWREKMAELREKELKAQRKAEEKLAKAKEKAEDDKKDK